MNKLTKKSYKILKYLYDSNEYINEKKLVEKFGQGAKTRITMLEDEKLLHHTINYREDPGIHRRISPIGREFIEGQKSSKCEKLWVSILSPLLVLFLWWFLSSYVLPETCVALPPIPSISSETSILTPSPVSTPSLNNP